MDEEFLCVKISPKGEIYVRVKIMCASKFTCAKKRTLGKHMRRGGGSHYIEQQLAFLVLLAQ